MNDIFRLTSYGSAPIELLTYFFSIVLFFIANDGCTIELCWYMPLYALT